MAVGALVGAVGSVAAGADGVGAVALLGAQASIAHPAIRLHAAPRITFD
jgi:hypothetical protein